MKDRGVGVEGAEREREGEKERERERRGVGGDSHQIPRDGNTILCKIQEPMRQSIGSMAVSVL